jgi:ribose-phosphate pyrophosphokinase
MSERPSFEIISGRAHPEFAQKVAEHLDMPLTPVTLGDFQSGETSVKIDESIRGKHVFVLQ